MEKRHLVQFLKQKKRGAYTMLVHAYSEMITSMPITMALEIIREDLLKDCQESVELNYFSLARALARFKNKNAKSITSQKINFKDSHEINDVQLKPGRFKIGKG